MPFPRFFWPAVLFLSLAAAAQTSPPRAVAPARPDARAVHNSALIIDTHADTPQFMLDENYDLGTPSSDIEVNLDKARAGNLGAEFFSIWVDADEYKSGYAKRTLRLIDAVYRQVARHPDRMVMAYSADDIVKAHAQHKLAALLGIEGGHSIENDLGLLRDYYRLGARYMTLTHTRTLDWADSSGDIDDPKVPHHDGLTDFGVEVVREMNRLGMMVDVSHVSDRAFYKTLVVSRAPVIASHSSARALTNHPRNMTDDMLRAIARNGGVVMVNFFSVFIDENYRKAYAAQEDAGDAAVAAFKEKYRKEHHVDAVPYTAIAPMEAEWAARIPRPPLKSLIDHIDHIAKVAGVNHVGLGSDFDGAPSMPLGMDSVADLSRITQALLDRGYAPEQVHKILGGNLLHVFAECERVSRQLQKEAPLGKEPLGASPPPKPRPSR